MSDQTTLETRPPIVEGAVEAPWMCHACGQDLDGACDPSQAVCEGADFELITYRLEQAGATLFALRVGGYWPAGLSSRWPEILREAVEAYGWEAIVIRPIVPSPRDISRMDAAFGWLQRIPSERKVLRRIVAARSLVHPLSGRHLISWRRLGRILGADHHAVIAWHRQGIELIVQSLAS